MNDRISIFDTTLRDGEQAPGCSMNADEKVTMARQLERLGVDVIEAGFPMASAGDFDAVSRIAESVERPSVACLCRAVPGDIDRGWNAIRRAQKPRIHTFIATSDIHLRHKLNKSRDEALRDAVLAVRHAASVCPDVEFSCEDASRTDLGFLCEIVEAAVEAGATVINLPDTVGYAIPGEYGAMFETVRRRVSSIARVVLSAHCHNDLGLAVANSLAAIEHGARQVECTVNGIGERAGNAALEELVAAIKTRSERLGVRTGVATEEVYRSSRLLSGLTGMMVQRNKAIVGANAFAHEAGIHQDGMLKSAITYEIMTPQSFGIRHSTLVLGKHSGRHGLKQRYAELGFELSPEELDRAYRDFCALADQKKEVFDQELIALLGGESAAADAYHLAGLHVSTGTAVRPTATVELQRGTERFTDSATGDGPVDAACKAIERITGVAVTLTEYSLTSVGLGHDTVGEVFVRVSCDGVQFNGRAVSTDVIAGSVRAYLEALNRALASRRRKAGKKKEPAGMSAVVA